MPASLLVVHDANILIALLQAGVLKECLETLGFRAWTTEFVVQEITDTNQARSIRGLRSSGHLKVDEVEPDEVLLLAARAAQRPALSLPDHSVLRFAERTEAIVLSGDRPMRLAARSLAIEIHGLLWVLDRLEDAGWSHPRLVGLLDLFLDCDNRLPPAECNRRRKRWSPPARA